jgi:hypothetical protein
MNAHQGPKVDGPTGKVPFNGWTNEGLCIFNDVGIDIKQDRIDCPDFDNKYSATWALQFVKSKPSAKRKHREVVAVYNELSASSVGDTTNP